MIVAPAAVDPQGRFPGRPVRSASPETLLARCRALEDGLRESPLPDSAQQSTDLPRTA